MNLIGHRGYKSKFIKENTIESFNNALNNGFLGIELDVRSTKDGYLVVCHDPFIDRVSDGHGLVKSYFYSEISKYNFGSKEVPSKIPLLKDILKKYKCIKLVELKVRLDIESILSYLDDNTYFISFDTSYIFSLKEKYPNIKFGVLNYVLNSSDVYNLDAICLLDSVVTDNIINYFTKKNIKVFIYGIKDKPNYKRDDLYYITNRKFDDFT